MVATAVLLSSPKIDEFTRKPKAKLNSIFYPILSLNSLMRIANFEYREKRFCCISKKRKNDQKQRQREGLGANVRTTYWTHFSITITHLLSYRVPIVSLHFGHVVAHPLFLLLFQHFSILFNLYFYSANILFDILCKSACRAPTVSFLHYHANKHIQNKHIFRLKFIHPPKICGRLHVLCAVCCVCERVSVFEHNIYYSFAQAKFFSMLQLLRLIFHCCCTEIHISLTKMCAYEALFDCRSHHERMNERVLIRALILTRARAHTCWNCTRVEVPMPSALPSHYHISLALFLSLFCHFFLFQNNAQPILNVWRSQC